MDKDLNSWYQKGYTKYITISVLTLLTIYLTYTLFPLIETVANFLIIITFPFILSLILYYFARPIVRILEKKIPITLAIAIVYALFIALITFAIIFIYPHILDEIEVIKSINYEEAVKNIEVQIEGYKELEIMKWFDIDPSGIKEIKTSFITFLEKINVILINNLFGLITSITEFIAAVAIAPVILFYLLKDDQKIYARLCQFIPKNQEQKFKDFLGEIDSTLMKFLTGRIIVSGIVSILLFISFIVIGINYSYLLAIISFIFIIIPTVGSFLALFLPLMVGFSMSTLMGIKVFIIMGVAMSLEGFLITPNIMGKSLYIHPLTIIFILMAAGSLFGIIGILFITPLYALFKVLVKHIYLNYNKL